MTDAFVTVELGDATHRDARLFKTKSINDCLNPKWDEKVEVEVCHTASTLSIHVHDKEVISADFIGMANIPVDDFFEGLRIQLIRNYIKISI